MTPASIPDDLVRQLAAMQQAIAGHDNVQLLLDLAADEADRRALDKDRSVRLAWRVATAAGAMTLAAFVVAGGAIATSMQPAPPPEVLVVDRANGVVQPLVSLASFQMAPAEATIRRNVNTFILARESYSYALADPNYTTAAAFMSPQLRAQWVKLWDPANLESPVNRYKKQGRIEIEVGAITLLRNGYGAPIGVRAGFTRQEFNADQPSGPATRWIATLAFHWVNAPTSERERRINDLGWEVTDYAADRDLGAPPSAAPVPAAAPPQAAGPALPMALVAPTLPQQVLR